jgi:hypothetical protein
MYLANGDVTAFLGLDMRWSMPLQDDIDNALHNGTMWFSFRGPDTVAEVNDFDEDKNPQYNVYIFLPVYGTQSTTALTSDTSALLGGAVISQANTTAARLADGVGVVLAEVRMYRVLQTMLLQVEDYPMRIELWDQQGGPKPNMNFISGVRQ